MGKLRGLLQSMVELFQPPVMNGYIPVGDWMSITVGGSPFTFTNPETWPVDVYANGVLTGFEVRRGTGAFMSLAITASHARINPGDAVRVTYLVAPTMNYYPG